MKINSSNYDVTTAAELAVRHSDWVSLLMQHNIEGIVEHMQGLWRRQEQYSTILETAALLSMMDESLVPQFIFTDEVRNSLQSQMILRLFPPMKSATEVEPPEPTLRLQVNIAQQLQQVYKLDLSPIATDMSWIKSFRDSIAVLPAVIKRDPDPAYRVMEVMAEAAHIQIIFPKFKMPISALFTEAKWDFIIRYLLTSSDIDEYAYVHILAYLRIVNPDRFAKLVEDADGNPLQAIGDPEDVVAKFHQEAALQVIAMLKIIYAKELLFTPQGLNIVDQTYEDHDPQPPSLIQIT